MNPGSLHWDCRVSVTGPPGRLLSVVASAVSPLCQRTRFLRSWRGSNFRGLRVTVTSVRPHVLAFCPVETRGPERCCAASWGFVLGARATSVLGGVGSACCWDLISSGGSMNNSTCVARAGQGPWIKRFLAPADRGSVNEYENCHYFYCLPDRSPGTAPGGEPAARMGQLHPVCWAHVGGSHAGQQACLGAVPPA